ncbi:hypothetical protein CKQ79_29105, partial [Klebsiella pneumoniae]
AAAAPGRVHCTAAGGLSQPALWRCPLIALSDNVTLLREFLLDEAPASLMAGLRQRRRCAWASSLHCSWRSQPARAVALPADRFK